MSPPEALAGQAVLTESYGAHCVYVTDSGGAMTMDDVAARLVAVATGGFEHPFIPGLVYGTISAPRTFSFDLTAHHF